MTQRPRMTLTAAVIDAPGTRELAAFCRRLPGWTVVREEPDWVKTQCARGWGGAVVSDRIELREANVAAGPGDQQMMVHLDIEVEDPEAASAHAEAAGVTLAEYQPEESVRVHLDPAGHPFCLWVPD